MRFNKHSLKIGDIVILDKGFRNKSEVKILHILPNGLFSTVESSNGDGKPWDVMTNRLTLKTENL